MICNIYRPSDFGLKGSSGKERGYAVFTEAEDHGQDKINGFVSYIVTDDSTLPPMADLDTAESFSVSSDAVGSLVPLFEEVDIDESGYLILPVCNKMLLLTDEQDLVLNHPSFLKTACGGFWRDDSEAEPLFRKDETLDMLPKETLDMRKFNGAVYSRYPALLDKTPIFYGHKYPEFPNAKYYEDKNKVVVFMTYQQACLIPQSVLLGKTPMYRDVHMGINWDIHNIYGICVVKAESYGYSVKLIPPEALKKYQAAPTDENIEVKA